MSIITAFPGIKRSVVYRFCFLPFLDLFFMKLTITFSAMLSLCRFGDHVLLFSGSTAMMLVFQASCSQISCDFFSPHRPTHPKPGNLFDAKRTKRGWPKPYGFFLGFLTTLLLRISVYLSFALFCSFLVSEVNWNCFKTLWRFLSTRKKMKNTMIYWPQGTKGKMTVDRLFTSRHRASFMMGLIASPCSWSWFKVLTTIWWCHVCCRDMFHKDLSTARESAATLSTMREMMYF